MSRLFWEQRLKVLKVWTAMLLVLTLSVFATPFAHNQRIPTAQAPIPLASTGPVYQVSLDANSLSQTDVTVATNATQVKSFRIGAVINSSTTNPLTGVYGWQFGIIYNSTAFLPLGDPSPTSGYPDGAASTALFGAQTTLGAVNWAGKIAGNQAFGSYTLISCNSPPCRFQEIQVFMTLLAPNPAVTISAKTLLANVNFELINKPGPPQYFNVTDVKFATSDGTALVGPAAGPPIIEGVSNSPPIANFNVSPAPNIGPSAFNFDATASSDPDGTISNPGGYFWDFGDGTQDLGQTGPMVTHDYGTNGTFIATLRVQDNLGATGSARDGLGGTLANPQPSHEKRLVGAVSDLPPIAQFTFSPLNSTLIGFDASNSTDPDGQIIAYNWEFGDGYNVSTTSSFASHAYHFPGNYTVVLTVVDDANLTATVSHVVPVGLTVDIPPIAIIAWAPTSPAPGSPAFFLGNQSYDPDGQIQSYLWNFGDGNTASGVFVSHTYASSGYYIVTLVVIDNAGASGAETVTIHVTSVANDQPPVALLYFSPGNVTTGQTVYFNGGNSYDPDGYVQSWYWSFGDGSNSYGSVAFHAYNSPGDYLVTLTVTDNAGLTASSSATISVRIDKLPVAVFTFTPSIPRAGQPVFFNGTASYDPDGYVQSWYWSFGDNGTGFGQYSVHFYAAPGNYTVSLTVTDNNGQTGTATQTLSVQPRPLHDVSIFAVTAYPQQVVSSQLVGVQVGLQNNGSSNETVSVTAYYGPNVIGTITGVFLQSPCIYCYNNVYVQIIWDTTGVPAGNYTISATVLLPTDQYPSDNSLTGNTVQVLPPPTLTIGVSSGPIGTTVMIHATNFPPLPYYYQATNYVFITFDDQFVGFATPKNGAFNFTFNVPLSQPGAHLIKAIDQITRVHASASFQVTSAPPPSTLTLTVQVGTIYFPQETVLIYSQVTLNGQPTTPSSFQLQLYQPNGSSIILTTQSIGPGMYRSTYLVPKSGPIIGTYLLVGKAHNNTPLDASGIASFEVKQTWLNNGGKTVIAGVAATAVFGLAIVAWKRGYFRKQDETIPF